MKAFDLLRCNRPGQEARDDATRETGENVGDHLPGEPDRPGPVALANHSEGLHPGKGRVEISTVQKSCRLNLASVGYTPKTFRPG